MLRLVRAHKARIDKMSIRWLKHHMQRLGAEHRYEDPFSVPLIDIANLPLWLGKLYAFNDPIYECPHGGR